MSIKKSNDTSWDRTSDLPICSARAHTHTHTYVFIYLFIYLFTGSFKTFLELRVYFTGIHERVILTDTHNYILSKRYLLK